uniref:Reverse transcriptase domain-containing protein n=1 Tax=Graphocephala atropunctata TaxID=36148 RepID=A0A1B6LG11_9HEMI
MSHNQPIISQGVFPMKLKLAKVFPKRKKGSETSVENYRPISILPTISKIIEKILLNQLITHLSTHDILTAQQHGFFRGRSTTTALVQLTEFIIDQLEEGTTVTAMLLDFSKAFDSLNHTLLLQKVSYMGIRGISQNWLASYLKDRQQLVEVNYSTKNTSLKARSSLRHINTGVPQGSILGPVLFILLTNDLPSYLCNWAQAMLYADDTALLVARKDATSLETNSFIALNMTKQYCQLNDLVLNESKTQQLTWKGRRTIDYNGLPEINQENEAKYLCITIDDKLSWNSHIDELCNKLNSCVYALKRIKSTCNNHTAKTAYFSLFESHLRYGLIVWGNSSTRNRERILVLQKKAIRILAGLTLQDSCRHAFEELGILTVVSLYISETICFTITQNPDLGETHSYNTRNADNFALPIHHLTLFEKKPTYIGRKLFNSLPEDLKRRREGKNFKTALKTWLLTKSLYTIEEFFNA